MFCCHVRRYTRACHVMLQKAFSWLHECAGPVSIRIVWWLHEGCSLPRLCAEYFCVKPGIVKSPCGCDGCDSDPSSDFHNFGADAFPCEMPCQNHFKNFFCFGADIRFWSCHLCSRCAYFFCAWQISLCRSQCHGCIKLPWCCSCVRKFFLQLGIVNLIEVAASRLRWWFVSRFSQFWCCWFSCRIPVPKCFKIVFSWAPRSFWSCNFCCRYVQASFSV